MQKIIPSRAVAFDDPSPTQSLIFETRYLQVLKALHSELALLVSCYDFDNGSILMSKGPCISCLLSGQTISFRCIKRSPCKWRRGSYFTKTAFFIRKRKISFFA